MPTMAKSMYNSLRHKSLCLERLEHMSSRACAATSCMYALYTGQLRTADINARRTPQNASLYPNVWHLLSNQEPSTKCLNMFHPHVRRTKNCDKQHVSHIDATNARPNTRQYKFGLPEWHAAYKFMTTGFLFGVDREAELYLTSSLH